MQDLFARLISALIAGGPDSTEVAQAIAAIKAQYPEEEKRARIIRDGWLLSRGRLPEQRLDGGNCVVPWYTKYLPWVLAALGLSGTAFGVSGIQNINSLNLDSLSLPCVTNRWALLGIVAAVGAVAGLVNSVLRNGGLILPAFGSEHDKSLLVVRTYGFVGDIFTGAAAAIAVTWTAFPTDHATDSASGPCLLQWHVLLSAAGAGWGGARVWSSWRNQNLLVTALGVTTKQLPASAQAVEDFKNATTIPEKVQAATGMQVPGFPALRATNPALPPPAGN